MVRSSCMATRLGRACISSPVPSVKGGGGDGRCPRPARSGNPARRGLSGAADDARSEARGRFVRRARTGPRFADPSHSERLHSRALAFAARLSLELSGMRAGLDGRASVRKSGVACSPATRRWSAPFPRCAGRARPGNTPRRRRACGMENDRGMRGACRACDGPQGSVLGSIRTRCRSFEAAQPRSRNASLLSTASRHAASDHVGFVSAHASRPFLVGDTGPG